VGKLFGARALDYSAITKEGLITFLQQPYNVLGQGTGRLVERTPCLPAGVARRAGPDSSRHHALGMDADGRSAPY